METKMKEQQKELFTKFIMMKIKNLFNNKVT